MVGELQSSRAAEKKKNQKNKRTTKVSRCLESQRPAHLVVCHHVPSLAFFAVDDHVAVVNGLVDERC
jgi:hypothetical protein